MEGSGSKRSSKGRRNCEKIVVIRKSDAHDSSSSSSVGKTFNKFHGSVVETRKKLAMNL